MKTLALLLLSISCSAQFIERGIPMQRIHRTDLEISMEGVQLGLGMIGVGMIHNAYTKESPRENFVTAGLYIIGASLAIYYSPKWFRNKRKLNRP